MPKDTPMAIGSVGSDATCAAQGFVILVFYLAFPFYYASISVFAYLAVKNNFNEEKYAWLEKWIHIGAYALPLSVSIASLAKGWYGPGLQFCNLEKNVGCDNYVECYDKGAFNIYEPLEYLILVELLVGTGTITVLLCKYEKMQREIDEAVGYTRIVETVRRRRLVEAAIQTGLYIFTFWFGYLPLVVESFIRNVSGKLTYDLIIASRCIFAFQGVLLMAIYLALSRINRSARISVARLGETTASCGETTVSKIRANAERKRRMSAHSSVSNRSAFKFSIFDGTPSDDSPWAQYFDDSERGGEISETSTTSDLSSRLISTGMLDEGEDWRS
ncbi:hypothetical protein THAOC_00707 [Thalassiosira oceanica]|uniref:G-protein coupled receptors family 1 profile domain-containing protein n=1 Tax=Thalassiosira oceanica TaxID=159749 RepID=K0TRA6_THAOC|nr:hypothetical protein THAOC_00707 [Thalassiosira oceanica]|eukprot:EJK77462.1 hypothetical protein THAOC_00707 [Thalassiosira oceanica]